MRSITKEFPGVRALDRVDLMVKAGEVHAIVGENGAGKSTLMKILAGAEQPDEGEILLEGRYVKFDNPQTARDHGVGMVFQELNLVPDLTVAENVMLGRLPVRRGGFVSRRELDEAAAAVLDSVGVRINPRTFVRDLSVGRRQLVEIAKAVSLEPKILVLDEPTSALTEHEAQVLMGVIRRLRGNGVAVLYISHRLREVVEIADRVTVLRDGSLVAVHDAAEVNPAMMVQLMVGREIGDLFPKRSVDIGQPVLEVRGLTRRGVFEDVSFSVRAGEILGFAGLVGAGRSEVARAIFGLDQYDEGEIFVDGAPVRVRSPQDAIEHGIGYVPEERKVDGLCLDLTARENLTLSTLGSVASAGVIRSSAERAAVEPTMRRFGVKPSDPERVVNTFSGGNQQKVVIGRWFATDPKVLFLDEPTRGIDVGAKAEIHSLIGELAATGVAIVMISSELVEVLSAADRVVVLHEGSITGEFQRAEMTEELIMAAATAEVTQ